MAPSVQSPVPFVVSAPKPFWPDRHFPAVDSLSFFYLITRHVRRDGTQSMILDGPLRVGDVVSAFPLILPQKIKFDSNMTFKKCSVTEFSRLKIFKKLSKTS